MGQLRLDCGRRPPGDEAQHDGSQRDHVTGKERIASEPHTVDQQRPRIHCAEQELLSATLEDGVNRPHRRIAQLHVRVFGATDVNAHARHRTEEHVPCVHTGQHHETRPALRVGFLTLERSVTDPWFAQRRWSGRRRTIVVVCCVAPIAHGSHMLLTVHGSSKEAPDTRAARVSSGMPPTTVRQSPRPALGIVRSAPNRSIESLRHSVGSRLEKARASISNDRESQDFGAAISATLQKHSSSVFGYAAFTRRAGLKVYALSPSPAPHNPCR